MLINSPCVITSRLLAGIKIDNAILSIEYDTECDREGRTVYRYYIDLESGYSYSRNDIKSGCQGGSLQDGLSSLLSFLSACGESYRYAGKHGENARLFPPTIAKWASERVDELSMASIELEEGNCIEE